MVEEMRKKKMSRRVKGKKGQKECNKVQDAEDDEYGNIERT
jgi:hypothetical protein